MNRDLTPYLRQRYVPSKILMIYTAEDNNAPYIESYSIGKFGRPINAHPLSEQECSELSLALQSGDFSVSYLTPKYLMPNNVLRVHPSPHRPTAMWYTLPQNVSLIFSNTTGIASGTANVPSLLWIASNNSLSIYALDLTSGVPNLSTKLYKAPFFNIYDNHTVCMGNVEVNIKNCHHLEDFIKCWENSFWNSKFSHLNGTISPVKSNIVDFWNKQIGSKRNFPIKELVPSNMTIKNLLQ